MNIYKKNNKLIVKGLYVNLIDWCLKWKCLI